MQAQLIIHDDLRVTELVLQEVDLGEPKPEHPLLAADYAGFSYYGHVMARTDHHWAGVTATIATAPGTGRDQAKLFDKLVGPRIAALRLTISREMRTIQKAQGDCGRQELAVHLDPVEIRGIRDRLQICADDEEPTFFVDSGFNLGRLTTDRTCVWSRNRDRY